MAREANVPLLFTLSQLSYWPALHLGKAGLKPMDVRGRMQEGMVADIVVFDPDTVAEGSGYENGKNGLPPKGLPHVIVSGHFVKKDGAATNAMAGKPIRYPVEDAGRFVPASKKQWLRTFSIDTGAVRPEPKDAAERQNTEPEKDAALRQKTTLALVVPWKRPPASPASDWFGDPNKIGPSFHWCALHGCEAVGTHQQREQRQR
jgi:hypothetical protein